MKQAQATKHYATEGDITPAMLLQVVQALVEEVHPRQAPRQTITLDSALTRDLGLDSLARVELLARIEQRFALTLPERLFAEVETPRDLLRAIKVAGVQPQPSALAEVEVLDLSRANETPASIATLMEVLQWHVQQHPDRPHIRLYSEDDTGATITYGQLWSKAQTIAAALQQRGLQAGDCAAIMLPTGEQYFYAFFGILLAGGIPVPIYPPVRPAQFEEHLRRHAGILANCLALTLITSPEVKRVAQLLKSQVVTLQSVVTVEELLSETGPLTMPVRGAQDTALLQYTSGSTGRPKGVVLNHANLLINIRAMGQVVQADSSDVFVSWLPLYHDMGLIGAWLGSLYYAALFVVMSPLHFLARPQRWLWAIDHFGGTLSAAPNFGYELCLRRIKDTELQGLDLSRWRAAFNGAEAVSPETMLNFYERFRHYGLRNEALMPVYGLAECSVGVAFPPLERGLTIDYIQRDTFMRSGRAIPAEQADQKALRFVACGSALPGHQIRIIDPLGRELPDRQEGRLQFCGPSATSGYYRNPEQTARLFDGEWLDSGDLGYTVNGDVYITGRRKDIIIRAGRNIYPDELEEAVGDLAGIRKGRVAVFASHDPRSGTERLVVMAETHEHDSETLEQLQSRINTIATDLAGIPPDEVVLAPPGTVLKTSSGKIRRAASREVYERGQIGKASRALVLQIAYVLLAGIRPQLRRLRQTLVTGAYGIYARVIFWIMAPLVWLGVAILPYAGGRWAVMRGGGRLLAWATGTPFRVQGLEHLPSADQACVFVANHASYLDGPVLVAAASRRFSFVAKAELLEGFVPRVFLRRIGSEFVERFDQQKGIADARHLVSIAQRGRSLMFFPEGTFTRVAGLLPFHMGAFVAAAEAKVPVVPVVIRGTRSILRADAWFPHHGAISVIFGKPIFPEETAEVSTEGAWASAVQLRASAREEILRHCGEPDLAYEKPVLEMSD